MDPIFVNRCTFNKKNLMEMTKHTRRGLRVLVYVCGAILLLTALVEYFVPYDFSMAFYSLFLGLFFSVYMAFLPRLSARITLKRNNTLYHAEVVSELRFYADHFASSSEQTHAHTDINYPQIRRVIRTKHLYLLQLDAQLVLLADKAGFADGASCAAFESFLREKATRARFVFPRRTSART